ncbi:transcriptional regulator [Microlunatus endophyticus]|jgi:DeoR family transcriptional regulator of aga operon|uniref:Transcriptional regulator n=1 Tax=Microlunatus endophyticus TaxID=1716077 RepID=A0A917S459_9ACTN|nr:DeoR/GlpR family DNA-binding transcription regulator [Microlunatus endophyticus]GGL56971.1 transcriptional regulator [Microlunatus endophyticus]
MTRAERLTALLERLVEQGRIDVEQSAHFFGVSAATIRRDLDHLADQQLLSRTHGGAVPNSTSYDLPLRYKSSNRAEAKTRIAERAVGMLWPGCTVAMNGGTTTVEIARTIPTSAPLHNGITIVTNAINIATEMTVRPFIKIVVCGGVARPQSYELVGPLASETLSQLTPDICFLGATGVEAVEGVTTDDEDESAINRIMVTRSKRAVVVADASKFGEVGFSRICQLSEVSTVLTDADADPEQIARVRDHGVDVIVC